MTAPSCPESNWAWSVWGRIGGRVARIALAFEMQVAVYDPYISQARADELGVQRVDSLEQLLGMADVVSLHLPSTAQTRGLINADTLAQMKPGALLVNSARGTLVDEDALLAALESGQLGGLATDVFAQEPPPHDHPLVLASEGGYHAARGRRHGREQGAAVAAGHQSGVAGAARRTAAARGQSRGLAGRRGLAR